MGITVELAHYFKIYMENNRGLTNGFLEKAIDKTNG